MSDLPTNKIQPMPNEELAALIRKTNKKAMRNLIIFAGVKVAIMYGLHRWAKSVNENI